MEEKTRGRLSPASRVIYILVILFSAPAVSGVLIYLTEYSLTGLVRNVIVMLIMSGVLLIIMDSCIKNGMSAYDNAEHPMRFMVSYLAAVAAGGAAAILPQLVVPLAALCVIAALLSDCYTGMAVCMTVSAVPLLVAGGSFEYYLFYFLTGVLVITLMMCGNREFRVREPLIIFTLIYTVAYTALIIMKRKDITPAAVINPAVGLGLDLIIMAIAFRMISAYIVFRYRDRYAETVDPEYHLLLELKEKNRSEFKRAIHTSYLCERIAALTGTDSIDMKGAGFYHRIGVLSDGQADINAESLRIIKEEKLPPEIIRIIEGYCAAGHDVSSKEVSVLVIADSVIAAVLNEFEVKKVQNLDSDRIIDEIFSDLSYEGIINDSALSMHELNKIRKYLKEEKLYYDFLR